MKTLTIQEVNALRAYNGTDTNGKQLLSDLFGKEVFNQKITDRVKTFDDAQQIAGTSKNQDTLLNYSGIDPDMLAAQAQLKLTIIAKALNEGWAPNWDNSSEYKYYPYFAVRSGFSFHSVVYRYAAISGLGSRLCFKNEALAKYAGIQFLDLYKQLMIVTS